MMTISDDKTADLRVKHLDYIQSVVSRLSGQTAALKNQCVTVTTAICGFAITLKNPAIVGLAALPVVAFAWLDARYLNEERLFRALYDKVRAGDWTSAPAFEMTPPKSGSSLFSAFLSWAVCGFYVPVAIGAGLVMTALILTPK